MKRRKIRIFRIDQIPPNGYKKAILSNQQPPGKTNH